jgi:predicted RNA-binding Zn-ribbon protein involved in translation (DUF1610 family)
MRDDAISIVKQELWCHGCNNYVQFELDMSKDGNHVFACPTCGHEHCRVVRRGRITSSRWAARNGYTFAGHVVSTSVTTNLLWTSSAATVGNYVSYSNGTSYATA